MFGIRGLRSRLPRLQQPMPATPLGWTLPFCGVVLPTGCPRRPGRTRLPPRLLRRHVPLLLQLIGSGSASTTLVVRARYRHLSRRRRRQRPCSSRWCPQLQRRRQWRRRLCSRRWCPLLQRHRQWRPRLQSLLHAKLVPEYGFTASSTALASPLSGNTRAALADANWRAAMIDEYKALVDNGTWRLVPRPPRANVITGKWVFKHKYNANGSLARHKARWVVCGFS